MRGNYRQLLRMRIQAKLGGTTYQIYDAESCRVRRDIVWLDDYTGEYAVLYGTGVIKTYRSRSKILVFLDTNSILINCVNDEGESGGLVDKKNMTKDSHNRLEDHRNANRYPPPRLRKT